MQLYEKALDLFEDDQSTSVRFSLMINNVKTLFAVMKMDMTNLDYTGCFAPAFVENNSCSNCRYALT